MDALAQRYEAFAQILSDEELKRLAAEHGVVDQRERRLPVRIFFWLMVLSASQPGVRGNLFQLAAFFVGALAGLFPTPTVVRLSKMALSKKLKGTHWHFFRAVYNTLLVHYESQLPASERHLLDRFKEVYAIDGSVARVHSALEKFFGSVHPGQAALKLNTKFSVKNLSPKEVEVSAGKRHDSRYNGVTDEAGVLYLFDLGYWAFKLFERICAVGSFFVSRLKKSCDPLIVAVTNPEWAHLVGKRLSEVMPLLAGQSQLDVTVQLSKAKKPRWTRSLRLVGLFHEGVWRFWITNIFEPAFTPQLIFDLYRQRWLVELFFNYLKHGLYVQHLISRNENGIMVEIYSALILYLLTQIVIALAAEQSGLPLEAFSFKRSCELVKAFLLTHLSQFLGQTRTTLLTFFQQLVQAVALMGQRDRCRSPA